MPKVTYIGDEKFIQEGGVDFLHGQAVEVDEDHPRLTKLAHNPTFEVDGYQPPKEDPKAAERAEKVALMKALDEAGIEYDGRLANAKLRKLLESGGESAEEDKAGA